MELSLVIAALSLLVTTLSETRAIWKDSKKKEIRSLGLSLLQTVSILDEIIDVGERIVALLARVPLTKGEKLSRIAILGKKWELLNLIKEQQENLEAFAETIGTPLSVVKTMPSSSVNNFIEIMIPSEIARIQDIIVIKKQFLNVAAWKLVESEVPASWSSISLGLALKDFGNSIIFEKKANELKIQIPSKTRVKILAYPNGSRASGQIEGYKTISYDLTKPSDLRLLLSLGNERLDSLREFREQLAQLIRGSFSINDVLTIE